MNKSFRQGQILQIVRSKGIYTQEELARELGERGVQATQVTLSRDMREIGLVKTADGYRQLAAEKSGPDLAECSGRLHAGYPCGAESRGAQDFAR